MVSKFFLLKYNINMLNYILSLCNFNVFSVYTLIFVMLPIWYTIGLLKKDTVRMYMYNMGLSLSQKCKKIPYWDKYVETFFIKQLAIMFAAGNSFVEGMVSDNDNKEEIEHELEEMRVEIKDELKIYTETSKNLFIDESNEMGEDTDEDTDEETDEDTDEETDEDTDEETNEDTDEETNEDTDEETNEDTDEEADNKDDDPNDN